MGPVVAVDLGPGSLNDAAGSQLLSALELAVQVSAAADAAGTAVGSEFDSEQALSIYLTKI